MTRQALNDLYLVLSKQQRAAAYEHKYHLADQLRNRIKKVQRLQKQFAQQLAKTAV
jgi:hypothetical protein